MTVEETNVVAEALEATISRIFGVGAYRHTPLLVFEP